MANELAAASVVVDSLELSIDLLGKDSPTADSDASLKGPTSQIIVISGSILVRFQNLGQVEAWIKIYVQTATGSSFMIALFRALLLVETRPGNHLRHHPVTFQSHCHL
jgi:hypothetical protein